MKILYCISIKSAPQTMFLKDEYNLCFSNLLISDLCNSTPVDRVRSDTLATRAKSKRC